LPFALENFQYFFDDASKFHSQASKVIAWMLCAMFLKQYLCISKLNGEIADLVGQDRDKFKADPPPKREFARSAHHNTSRAADVDQYAPISVFQHSLNTGQPLEDSSHDSPVSGIFRRRESW